MSIYDELAQKLLLLEDYEFFNSSENGSFGFEYKKDYSGLMARPNRGKVKRAKQGFFDIVVKTGTRFKKITHRQTFEDLIKSSDEEFCLRAWRGEDPRKIGRNVDEKEALTSMVLLMFEQEVNWGNEVWQRGSNFPPYQKTPDRRRPRDMLMGYIRQSFSLGLSNLDELKYWMKTKPGTTTFNNPNGDNQYFRQYPPEYKKNFDELEHMKGGFAVMVQDNRQKFRDLVADYPDNPLFGEK